MSLDVMKQALEVLESVVAAHGYNSGTPINAITALRAAIEQAQPDELMIWKSRAMNAERIIEKFMQPEQEPVAWMYVNTDGECEQIEYIENDPMPDDPSVTPLYTAPRQWQGLTQREIDELWDLHHDDYGDALSATGYERAIEAKLRERNT